jgi:hypothetical protein
MFHQLTQNYYFSKLTRRKKIDLCYEIMRFPLNIFQPNNLAALRTLRRAAMSSAFKVHGIRENGVCGEKIFKYETCIVNGTKKITSIDDRKVVYPIDNRNIIAINGHDDLPLFWAQSGSADHHVVFENSDYVSAWINDRMTFADISLSICENFHPPKEIAYVDEDSITLSNNNKLTWQDLNHATYNLIIGNFNLQFALYRVNSFTPEYNLVVKEIWPKPQPVVVAGC